jgi:hypothetical protein
MGGMTPRLRASWRRDLGLQVFASQRPRGYGKRGEIREPVRQTLCFVRQHLAQEHGLFHHFLDIQTGQRIWHCELSSIDTSLLLCGVLTASAHFNDAEIQDLASAIYERVDWPWMMNGGQTFSMGWKPEGGFLNRQWDHYCELMMIYLLALGSPSHPVSKQAWDAWSRPTVKFHEFESISGDDPGCFTHQYSQAWFDFRNKRDAYANYFNNSAIATRAHKRFCRSLHDQFPDYSDHVWGISSSDSASGYQAWGGPPRLGRLDGSVVPWQRVARCPFFGQTACRCCLPYGSATRERGDDMAWSMPSTRSRTGITRT